MKLNEIRAPRGANVDTKRRGRGSGSGHGKNSCRGRKGAKKRSGRTTRPGFEGGQMPLIRRIPKRGFNSRFKDCYQVVNVESLNRFTANSVIGPKELKSAGLIGSEREPVKILGDGKLDKILTVKAHRISEAAKKQFDTIGAKIEMLSKPPAATAVKKEAPAVKKNEPAAKKQKPTTDNRKPKTEN